MEKDRQTKLLAILALFIGVATLTLGFAAFSTRLIIQQKATVTPDADTFKVVLSTEQTRETAGTLTPTGKGEEATIDNNDIPTISNLKANFINPGEKVVYELYAVNVGEYDAYLNKINYENIDGQTINKICSAEENTTDSYVQSACESIRVTVKVSEDDKACQTSTYGAHKLEKKTGEKVVVTIEYNKEGARADGPFEVTFGDITLNYSTVDTEAKNVPACEDFNTQIVTGPMDTFGRTNIVDNDNNGKISTSDKVTLGTEPFYVVSTDEAAGTVTMLAEWNLNVGNKTVSGTSGMQNEACKAWINGLSETDWKCTADFSSTSYWSSTTTYPAWVFNNQSNLYTYIENYANNLKELGYSSVTGRLIKYEELENLGCSEGGGVEACNSAPSWVKNTTYWAGSANSSSHVWGVNTDGNLGHGFPNNSASNGVRPVITINASEI